MKQNILKRSDVRFLIIILSITALVYCCFTYIVSGNLFRLNSVAYYNYFLSALLHLRLDLLSPEKIDLSKFGGRWYMYWGPAPSLFIAPFYLLGRLKTSDVFYTMVAGIANVVVFYFLIKEFLRYFKITISRYSVAIILFSFAFASPNFYMSLKGAIWQTNQLIAVFYLLLSLFWLFKFLNEQSRLIYFICFIISLNLAWFSRYTMVFNLLIVIYPLIIVNKTKNSMLFRKILMISIGVTSLFLMNFFSYNHLRFGNILETGFRYQETDVKYRYVFRKGEMFSTKYIPRNLFYYFVNPLSIKNTPPFFKIDIEGNSVFLVYPLLLSLLFIFRKKLFDNKKILLFLRLGSVIILMNLFILMLNVGTGWVQFGNRYFLDVVPLLFLMTIFTIEFLSTPIKTFLFVYGVAVNILGSLIFYQIIK